MSNVTLLPYLECSGSYKSILQTPLPFKEPSVSRPSNHRPDSDTVYDAPCKTSPTSNSSVCSLFSGSESHYRHRYHQHHYNRVLSSAQPYETPLVTPLSSRQNLFNSNSTLNTMTGSEVLVSKTMPVHPQSAPPGTMTLDRLRKVKLKKPLPVVKPATLLTIDKPASAAHLQVPERGSREKPTLTVPDRPPKPRVLTLELPEIAGSPQDEGYCTARHPVRLLQQVITHT